MVNFSFLLGVKIYIKSQSVIGSSGDSIIEPFLFIVVVGGINTETQESVWVNNSVFKVRFQLYTDKQQDGVKCFT